MTNALRFVARPGEAVCLGRPKLNPLFLTCLVIGVLMAALWLDGASQGFVPCRANCGEDFTALAYHVDAFHTYGFRFGLLETVGPPDATGRPELYTHNVNLAGILFTLLDAAGVQPLWAKQLLTLFAFGAGLFYAFRAASLYTRSQWFGLGVVLAFAADYEYVFRFGLNALRAWHWLALFGLIYHVSRIAQGRYRRRLDWIISTLLAVVAFGLGYDFWIICLLAALLSLLLLLPRAGWLRLSIRRLPLLIAIFFVPLILRQVQVAAVLGIHYWVTDLYYSAAIKVSTLGKILPTPSLDQIDAFYRAENVSRPPAEPASSVSQILQTARDMFTYITLPTEGLLTIVMAAAAFLIAIFVVVTTPMLPLRRTVRYLRAHGVVGPALRLTIGGSRLVTVLAFSTVLGLAFFAPLSLHIYLKHQFPLVAAPINVSKVFLMALGIYVSLRLTAKRTLGHGKAVMRFSAAGLLVALTIADEARIQFDDFRAEPPAVDMSWVKFVQEHSNARLVLSGIWPYWVEPFDPHIVGMLSPEQDVQVLSQLRQLSPGNDVLPVRQILGSSSGSQAATADYWLYVPTEGITPQFDRPDPVCRQDYLTHFVGQLADRGGASVPLTGELKGLWPTTLRAGDTLSSNGSVTGAVSSLHFVTLRVDGRDAGHLPFNCQYNTFQGTYRLSEDVSPGTHKVEILASDGHEEAVIASSAIIVDPSAAPSGTPPPLQTVSTTPPVHELQAVSSSLKMADQGQGFVAVDMNA